MKVGEICNGFKKVNIIKVKKDIQQQSIWKGYLVGNKVNCWHINQGWHLGVYQEITTVEQLKKTCSNFLYYLDSELGNRVAFFEEV